jgi:hypothetical protein
MHSAAAAIDDIKTIGVKALIAFSSQCYADADALFSEALKQSIALHGKEHQESLQLKQNVDISREMMFKQKSEKKYQNNTAL